GDSCELVLDVSRCKGPFLQHHRLPCRTPSNVTDRDSAARLPNVLADREIGVMSGEPSTGIAGRVPELGEAGININVDTVAKSAEERFGDEVPADVDQ